MSRPDAISIALALVLLLACGGDEAQTAAPEPPIAVDPAAPEPSAPEPEPTPSPTPSSPVAARADAVVAVEAPEAGCALADPQPLGVAGVEWVDVAAADGGFTVAVMRRRPRGGPPGGDVEELFVGPLGAPLGEARHLLEHALPATHRRAAPVLVERSSGRSVLAFTDGERRLLLLEVDSSAPPVLAATSASERFAPAIVEGPGGGLVLAWTDASDTPMRVRSGRVGADLRSVGEPRDLTPEAGGAAAPSFVSGALGTLVFLDPRAATSVALRAEVLEGEVGAAEVARPIGLVAEPPEIAAVSLASGVHLAFTGVGALARSAVGLANLTDSAPPRPLVPGTGYGALHVDAEALEGGGAVVVADAPQAAAPDSPREVHVRLLDDAGEMSEPARLRGPAGSARRARVARSGRAIAVAFVEDGSGLVALGRCAAP